MNDRAPLLAPLSSKQEVVAELVASSGDVRAVARALGLSLPTVREHVQLIAKKIPGDLPAVSRIRVWARGGSIAVLGGAGEP